MKFLFHNKLGRIWFLIWFIVAWLYLITSAIRRYIECKAMQYEKVFEREIDGGVMNFYLTCIIAAIVLGILCVYCTVFRTGNYANDSMQFGERLLDFKVIKMKLQREQINRHLISDGSCLKPKLWNRMMCHFPPYYVNLYLLMSVTLLLALPYLEAEKIRNGIGSTNSRMHSNLDFIFNIHGKYQDSFRQSTNFEFFNLCISLLLHTFAYSHVFWKYNKTFALLFSIVIFVHGIIFILDVALIEMFIKLSRDSDPKLYTNSPQALTILSLIAFLFLIIHQISLFEYGYIRITETLLPKFSIDASNNCQTYNNDNTISVQLISICKQLCIESWSGVLLPFAVGIFSAVLNIGLRLLYIYRGMTSVYPQFKDGLIVANLIMVVLFLTFTIALWVCLLLRQHWPIKTMESTVDHNGECLLNIRRHSNHVQSLPIYASINRRQNSSGPIGQDPSFSLFCDQSNSQWRYSCSPPSCGPNDSNSDRTVSCTNGDINNINKNYIMLRRGNPVAAVVDSPNINHGIYSQLIKLTPQNSQTDNNDNMLPHSAIPNDISESSSNQTVHIISPVTLDLSRGTIERSSGRNRVLNSSEYFNIVNFIPQPVVHNDIYDQSASLNTEAEATNLCSQV